MTGSEPADDRESVTVEEHHDLLIATYGLLAARSSHEDGLAETRHGVYAVTQTATLGGVALLVSSSFRGTDAPTGASATALAFAVVAVALFGLALVVTWMRAIVAAHTYVEAAGMALEELESRLYCAGDSVGFTRLNELVSERRGQRLHGWGAPAGPVIPGGDPGAVASQSVGPTDGADDLESPPDGPSDRTGEPGVLDSVPEFRSAHRGGDRSWREWVTPVVPWPPPPARSGRGAQFAAASVFAAAWTVVILVACIAASMSVVG